MILFRLLGAKLNLDIASLVLPRFVLEIVEIVLIIVVSPSMREYCIGRNIVEKVSSQAELALAVDPQKAHHVDVAFARRWGAYAR